MIKHKYLRVLFITNLYLLVLYTEAKFVTTRRTFMKNQA